MERPTIDLNRAEKAVSSITGQQQSGYEPRTLRSQNGGRSAYLPAFPTNFKSPKDRLLLTHVPGNYFSANERITLGYSSSSSLSSWYSSSDSTSVQCLHRRSNGDGERIQVLG